jgi:ceramide glucosyltransferase
MSWWNALGWILLVPVAAGALYHLLCVAAMVRWRLRRPVPPPRQWPAVSIVKPVTGLEKNLRENLRSTVMQDYPEFEVIFSVQRRDDPALGLLYEVQREFGPEKVIVAVDEQRAGANGKINNMLGAMPYVRHPVLVISDSDVRLEPGYLKAIVAPLAADERLGYVCTPYKAACADRWFEKLELLSLNADFMPSVIFAYETGLSAFCLGASIALRTEMLEKIGGLAALADYLVEDYELGRRIRELGYGYAFVPPVIDTMVDLKTAAQWWKHQVYWDQNTRAARPVAFFLTLIIRMVPFALLASLARGFDAAGLSLLASTVAWRLATAAFILGWGFNDREGARALWLLPLRDLAGFASWLLSFVKGTTHWRGADFILTRDGRLLAKQPELGG